MSEDQIATATDEVDSPAEETQEEACEAPASEAEDPADSEHAEEAAGEEELADSENVVEEETEETDEDDNEIGFILLDEDGNEVEYYYDDDEEADAGEPGEDNPYDLGITREGVAEATSDMNDIYRDGVAIAVDLKDALSEIKEAFDFSDILPTKKK